MNVNNINESRRRKPQIFITFPKIIFITGFRLMDGMIVSRLF